ncbi:lysozyme inhibitor LprI family protein [uncultured Cohaesibacter sp.]|uniref:lysozyme inhibitor LprI family protein n=1 Tax=uncultured Cohaesibacter sp. TaxID=1002546 RepID=UPI0029C71029|nr:lysozyme inhibitor LprI family protein [uncultured Cohaesibacter sp.]
MRLMYVPICALAVMALFQSPAAHATDPQINCKAPSDTASMLHCAAVALETADTELNAIYKRLISLKDEQGQEILRKAERAWIEFRDADCSLAADLFRGGSLEPVVFLDCRAAMTAERVKLLQSQVDSIEGS